MNEQDEQFTSQDVRWAIEECEAALNHKNLHHGGCVSGFSFTTRAVMVCLQALRKQQEKGEL